MCFIPSASSSVLCMASGSGLSGSGDTATETDHKVAQSKQRGRDARGVAPQARRAWQKAERCFDEEVQTEGVGLRVARALAVFRLDGELNERQ